MYNIHYTLYCMLYKAREGVIKHIKLYHHYSYSYRGSVALSSPPIDNALAALATKGMFTCTQQRPRR